MANAGAFKKGEKRPGQGRPKGSKNKETATIRQLIVEALDELGGVEYLKTTAASHPAAFLSLLGKVMPIQVANPEGESFKTENHWTIEVVEANAKADPA
jgi:dipeptidase